MDTSDIIKIIDEYAEETGLRQTTICQRALGNARAYERLQKRSGQHEDMANRLKAYICKHPPQKINREAAE